METAHIDGLRGELHLGIPEMPQEQEFLDKLKKEGSVTLRVIGYSENKDDGYTRTVLLKPDWKN